MLSSLFISNYALIDRMEIQFDPGLNIVTGETGAGKSIILGALSLLLGERADTKTIRSADRKTIVEAKFDISLFPAFNQLLVEYDVDTDEQCCILRREISTRGTSRAFVNDTPVNLTVLKTVSTRLIDIHTQHENILLSDAGFQMSVIDALAQNQSLLEEYKAEYSKYRKTLKQYTDFRDKLKRSKAESEYNAYLLAQLKELDLHPGEQESLEKQRDIVANAAEIKMNLSGCLDALSRNENDVLSQLSIASDRLERISDLVADSKELAQRLESARIDIADIVETLEEYDNTVTASEGELDEIERRLGEIYSLQSRHNVSTVAELIAIKDKLEQSLSEIENGDEILNELEQKARLAKKNTILVARKLSQSRIDAATTFARELKERAMPLAMPNLRCEIRITQTKLSADGMDEVEFLFVFNKNQSLLPVGKTASGGEKSRVILAIKSLLVEKMHLPTIIFDEVDTGVSGDVANRMAKLMLDISAHTQVITITHIATVAAHGRTHFKVFKCDDADSTGTFIKRLNDSERPHELAAMISGDANDPVALQTAHSLLKRI